MEISTKLIDLVLRFTTSPVVLDYSFQITTAATSLICTEDEKASLKAIDQNFQKASTEISKALTAIQEDLRALTGTTASAATIQEASSNTIKS